MNAVSPEKDSFIDMLLISAVELFSWFSAILLERANERNIIGKAQYVMFSRRLSKNHALLAIPKAVAATSDNAVVVSSALPPVD